MLEPSSPGVQSFLAKALLGETRVNSYSNARVFWYFDILISKNYKIMNYGMKGQTDRME